MIILQESWGDESALGMVGFQGAVRGLDKSQADSMAQQHDGEAELASPGVVLRQSGKVPPRADTNNVGSRSGDILYWHTFAKELDRIRAGNRTPTPEEATRYWQQVTEELHGETVETSSPEAAELQQGIGVETEVPGAVCAERQHDRHEDVVVAPRPDGPPRPPCGPVLRSRPASVHSETRGASLVVTQYPPLRRSRRVETLSDLDVSDILQSSATEVEAVSGGLVLRPRSDVLLQQSGAASVVEEEVEDEPVVESILITPVMGRRAIRGGSSANPTLGVPPSVFRDAVLSMNRSPYDGM